MIREHQTEIKLPSYLAILINKKFPSGYKLEEIDVYNNYISKLKQERKRLELKRKMVDSV
jgi:hypothetical protein